MGGTGGVIILGWTGPAVSTVRIATAWQGVTQFNTDINVGVNKRDMGSLTNNQSPTLTAGVVYDVSLDGFIVFSAGGTLVATLQEATAGVSFSTVGGSSFMDVTRIS
jgi:hypothetical protein